MLGFLGPNGAGKTTAMRAVFGLVPPDAGEVHWDGRPIGVAERLRFGYMPEAWPLSPHAGGRAARVLRTPTWHGMQAARAAASRWLARLGLEGRAAQRSRSSRTATSSALSSRQRRCTNRSSSSSTSRSRVSTRWRCKRSPKSFVERQPAARAVLFSSHQLELVEDICEEVAIIDHGRIVTTGDVDALKRASQRRRIELGRSRCARRVAADVAGSSSSSA